MPEIPNSKFNKFESVRIDRGGDASAASEPAVAKSVASVKFLSAIGRTHAANLERALTSYVVPASFVHLPGEQLEADDGVNDDDEEN